MEMDPQISVELIKAIAEQNKNPVLLLLPLSSMNDAENDNGKAFRLLRKQANIWDEKLLLHLN
jgi:hypothetical protein